MTGDRKPILCLDFDGVLHSYSSGWRGADVVSDPPVPGAREFLQKAVEHFDVQIFSSRSNQDGGINAMDLFLTNLVSDDRSSDGVPVMNQISYPMEKPPAMVTLDDRAMYFTGIFPAMEQLTSIISAAPYFQRKTRRHDACQIDVLIHTRNTLYVCEIKFRNRIDAGVMEEVQRKIENLPGRSKYSVRPVLIYEGKLAPAVNRSDFFCRLISAAELLTHP